MALHRTISTQVAVKYLCLVLVFITLGCDSQTNSGDGSQTITTQTDIEETDNQEFEPFRVDTVYSVSGEAAKSTLFFIDGYVVEFADDLLADPRVVFDLENERWRSLGETKWITLDQAKQWVEISTQRTMKSISNHGDPEYRKMVLRLLEPNFVIKRNGEELSASNQFVEYSASNQIPLDKTIMQCFLIYDRLSAYRKAMVDQKVPPHSQLAFNKVMAEQNYIPQKIFVQINLPNRTVEMSMKLTVIVLSEVEASKVEAAIQSVIDE